MNEALAVIPRSRQEETRVSLNVINGHNVVDVRIYALDADNKPVPTVKGISMAMKNFPAFVRALRKAERYVQKIGLLKDI